MQKNKDKGILYHAVLYLKRKKSRSAILVGIFFTLSVLVLAGMTLTDAVENSLEELRKQFYACLTVERTFDDENLVTPELGEAAAEVINPKKWSGTNTFYLSMQDLSLIPGKFTSEGKEEAHTARMVSCTESVLGREFTEGKLKLTEGEHIQRGDIGKAVISEELAAANGLKIGDTITGTVTDEMIMRARSGVGNTYNFQIVGIFQVDPEADNTSPQRAETEILSNYIYVDEKSGMDIQKNVWQEETEYGNGIIFWIEDPVFLADALEKLQSIPGYNWESYFINTNNAEYDRAAGPLTQMEKILFLMLAVVLALGTVILAIILTMWNQERTREMGIFLSMGFAKRKIMERLIMENLLVFAGSFLIAVPVVFFGVRFLGSAIDISGAVLKAGNVLAVGVGGLIFCAVITVLSSVKIMRVNPKEILVMPN